MPRDSWLGVLGLLVMACAPSGPVADAPPDGAIACGASAAEIRAACGSPTGPVGVECSPDGEGWCCPYGTASSSSCSCTSPTGGFVRSPCECTTHTICDLPAPGWGMRIDEHGCPTLEMIPTTACCICPRDAGPATDVP